MENHELWDLRYRIADLGDRAEKLRTTGDVTELARVVGQIAAIVERLIVDELLERRDEREAAADQLLDKELTDISAAALWERGGGTK